MIDPKFLAMLVCPASRQPLREASAAELQALNAAIGKGGLVNRSGAAVSGPCQGALATKDGAWFYPVQEGIPILLSAEAIAAETFTARGR